MNEPNRCHICGVISHLFTVHTVRLVNLPAMMINIYPSWLLKTLHTHQ